jgi:hypothetical protein
MNQMNRAVDTNNDDTCQSLDMQIRYSTEVKSASLTSR